MNSYCAVYELIPGKIDEYIELHDNCWQEQLWALRESGAENLEIFLYGTQCIITYICENFDVFLDNLSKSETNKKWQEKMNDFFVNNVNYTGEEKTEPVKKIFSLKEKLEGL
ncbi:MAG: L-rhamnose mutarotase [Anaerolineaceae bacterium]|nr:MAG: L-rhamnose mutarotase [Anaerolineaceae bacterium]